MVKFVDRVKMNLTTTGTGTVTFGSVVSGFQSLSDASVVDADVVRYTIESGTNYESGTGTIGLTGSTYTMARSPSSSSESDNSAINLGSGAVCFLTMLAEDVVQYIADLDNVSSTAPAGGQNLSWDSGTSSWVPSTPLGGVTPVDTLADMQAISNPATGALCLVAANNSIYMFNGTGWYKIAMVNESPSAISGVNADYTLQNDGTPTVITAVSTDPEGKTLSWSSSITSGSLNGTTITNVDNVFTITPHSSNATSFEVTFSVTDNVNGAVSTTSLFALSFNITNSRYTVLLASATNTGSNQTFDDASTSNYTITANGDVAASTFSAYRHGGYSLGFIQPGLDDNNIKFDNTSGSGAVAASGEFCVETWVKFTVSAAPEGTGNARIFVSNGSGGNASDNLQLFIEKSGSYIGAITLYSNGYIYQASSASEVINDGEWHHLAVTRDSSNNLRWFVDGILITTIASNTTTFQFEETRLGKGSGGTGQSCFTGVMRDTRVVIGSSVYQSAFTPPTFPLTAITNTYLLVGGLPYIKDESSNNFSINSGTFSAGTNGRLPSKLPISLFDNAGYQKVEFGTSAALDGTGDYLSVSNFVDLGTDSWTIEGFYYFNLTTSIANHGLFTVGRDNGSLAVDINESGGVWNLRVVENGVALLVQSNTALPLGAVWTHIAVTFTASDNTIRIYFNGNLDSNTGTKSSAWTFTETTLQLGARYYSNSVQTPFSGYVQDFRVTKGVVRYTANFTPPTSPISTDSDTKFLLNPETSISDLSQSSAITCVGDAATDATVVKFSGTKSIALDGTGDYLQTTLSEQILISQFTVEGWVRMSTVGGPEGVFHLGASAFPGNVDGLGIYTRSSTYSYNWGFFCNGASVNSSTAPSSGVWYHLALVRDSNNLVTMYLNGNSLVTSTQSGSIAGDILTIGGYYNSSYTWNGNIQDFRITKGLARYTSNFTPPTSSLLG